VPRLIDVDVRRREIAEATWRLVQREGLDAVSVRNVAREAGLSAGSVRHVFGTQAELLSFVMEALGERLGARLAALDPEAAPLDAAVDVLSQIVPLDEERHREAEVWFAFIARARVDPELRALSDRTDATLREIVRMAVAPLEPADVELAVEEVYALVDGLTLHAVVGSSSPETTQRVLRATLSKLTHSGA
jgi:AcrR family transcriptional regulator